MCAVSAFFRRKRRMWRRLRSLSTFRHTRAQKKGKEIKKRRNSKNMKHVAKNMCETSGPPGRHLFPRQRHLVHQELNRWRWLTLKFKLVNQRVSRLRSETLKRMFHDEFCENSCISGQFSTCSWYVVPTFGHRWRWRRFVFISNSLENSIFYPDKWTLKHEIKLLFHIREIISWFLPLAAGT